MATDDVQVLVTGQGAVPQQFTIPGNGQIQPKAVRAVYNGGGAVTSFIPVLRIISDAGVPVAECVAPLIAAGGSAAVSWFPHVAPTGTGGTTQVGWVRAAEPLMSPTVAWEQQAVQEPDVHYISGGYYMFYTGGWANPGMGTASCTGDPTIPANWHKYVSNPILGQGGSGVAGFVAAPNVVIVGATYHCFYTDAFGGGNLKRSTSADGINWNAPTTAIASNAVPTCKHGWYNSKAWFDGANWWLFVEGSLNVAGGTPWGSWVFSNPSISGDGAWTVGNGGNPLTSLAVPGYGFGYGQGPDIAQIDGTDTFLINGRNVLWYHVDKQPGGVDKTDITHAYTVDPTFSNWTQSGVFDLIHNAGQFEKDQVADACVLQVIGKSYMFFDGVDNETPAGYINVATYPGTLSALLAGTG